MARTKTGETAVAEGRTISRTFKMKKGVDVPEKFDGAEIRIRLAAETTNADEAMQNMLALTGGNVQAVLDTFNSAAALDVQKTVKANATEDSTVAQLQAVADGHVITENVRGRGESKKAATKAKAQKADEIADAASEALADLRTLRDEDRDAAEQQLALMIRLKVVPADTELDTL